MYLKDYFPNLKKNIEIIFFLEWHQILQKLKKTSFFAIKEIIMMVMILLKKRLRRVQK